MLTMNSMKTKKLHDGSPLTTTTLLFTLLSLSSHHLFMCRKISSVTDLIPEDKKSTVASAHTSEDPRLPNMCARPGTEVGQDSKTWVSHSVTHSSSQSLIQAVVSWSFCRSLSQSSQVQHSVFQSVNHLVVHQSVIQPSSQSVIQSSFIQVFVQLVSLLFCRPVS